MPSFPYDLSLHAATEIKSWNTSEVHAKLAACSYLNMVKTEKSALDYIAQVDSKLANDATIECDSF